MKTLNFGSKLPSEIRYFWDDFSKNYGKNVIFVWVGWVPTLSKILNLGIRKLFCTFSSILHHRYIVHRFSRFTEVKKKMEF